MKKAFTLIELLIVMVIVGVLFAIALPKYRNTVERGRALEGIANVRSVGEYLSAQCIVNGNSFPTDSGNRTRLIEQAKKDVVKSKYFTLNLTTSNLAEIIATRQDGWNYSLTGTIEGCVLQSIVCSDDDTGECADLDLLGNPDNGGNLL
ncbi:MAG: pilin [Elusimicrobiaceae bacterium]|nr:pilin [Elusimicrobiaceae bacterium]